MALIEEIEIPPATVARQRVCTRGDLRGAVRRGHDEHGYLAMGRMNVGPPPLPCPAGWRVKKRKKGWR